MQSDTHFFLIWTHGSADGLFGAASKPVIRNGSLLCFPNEVRARAECDRLSAFGRWCGALQRQANSGSGAKANR